MLAIASPSPPPPPSAQDRPRTNDNDPWLFGFRRGRRATSVTRHLLQLPEPVSDRCCAHVIHSALSLDFPSSSSSSISSSSISSSYSDGDRFLQAPLIRDYLDFDFTILISVSLRRRLLFLPLILDSLVAVIRICSNHFADLVRFADT